MALHSDYQKPEPGNTVRLIEVDGTGFGMEDVLRFHAYTLPHTAGEIATAADLRLDKTCLSQGETRNGTAETSDDGVIITSTAADSSWLTPGGLAVPGNKMHVIKIRARWIKKPSDDDGVFQIYWADANHDSSSGYFLSGKLSDVTSGRDDGWLEFTFDMTKALGADDWLNSTLTRVRFDLWQQAVGSIEISDIVFVNNDPADIDESALPAKPIWWQGYEYQAWPYQIEGIEASTSGSGAQPELTVANINSSITALCLAWDDLLKAKVTIHDTLAQYLDAQNFADGNPTADPAQEKLKVFYIDAKSSETNEAVSFTLSSPMDLQGLQIPTRQLHSLCTWCMRGKYRSGDGCDYAGSAYFDKNNNAVDDPSKDVCNGTLRACKLRCGENDELPFGGFPGTSLIRS